MSRRSISVSAAALLLIAASTVAVLQIAAPKPLNVIVLMPLLMNFSISTTFAVTTSILAVAVAAAFTLKGVPKSAKKTDDQELEEGIISSQSPDRTD